MSHLERVACIVGTALIGTAAYLVISDRRAKQSRSVGNDRNSRGEQEHPVEELAEELKQAWAGYHNR